MRIDKSGENVLAGRVDYRASRRRGKVAIDPRDRLPLAEDIGNETGFGGDDLAVFDEQ